MSRLHTDGSRTVFVPWSWGEADYTVECRVSPGCRQTYGQPAEDAELEVTGMEGDGPITDEMYIYASESDRVYESALEILAAEFTDKPE